MLTICQNWLAGSASSDRVTSLVISSSLSSVELTRYICELADPAKPVFAGENKAHHTTGNSAHLHLKTILGGSFHLKPL